MNQPTTSRESAGRRVVLVHGATSGPWVFDGWATRWPGDDVRIPDLQEGLDVAHATMSDYADRVVAAAGDQSALLCGWSIGGLVAMMAARRCGPTALAVIEPSVPQIDGNDPDYRAETGTYNAESLPGPSVPGMRHQPESLLAHSERKRGINIPAIDCPLLVVAGRVYLATRCRPVAEYYGAELVQFPTLSHFRLVVDQRVRDAVAQWADSVSR